MAQHALTARLDLLGGHDRRYRQPPANGLADNQDVRHDAVVLKPEPAAGAPHAGGHLFGDKEGTATGRQVAQPCPVAKRRHDHPASAHHRLVEHSGDVSLAFI